MHHASLELTAVFTDPASLSAWVDEVSLREGAQIDSVTWRLSDETASLARDRVAAAAVRDAVTRATAYAAALGHSEVTAVAVADAGLLSPDAPTAAPKMMRASFDAAAAPGVDLRPDDVAVNAVVEARFTAR